MNKFNEHFNNGARSRQLVDFNGLSRTTLNPNDKAKIGLSDMDFYANYRNKFILYGETKVKGKDFNFAYNENGQCVKSPGNMYRWQTLCDNLRICGIMVLTSHDTNPDDDILLAETVVEHVYVSPAGSYKGEWTKMGNRSFETFWDSLLRAQNIIENNINI